VGFCEDGDEVSVSLKQLTDHQLLREDPEFNLVRILFLTI
jgi:hypothetical protein